VVSDVCLTSRFGIKWRLKTAVEIGWAGTAMIACRVAVLFHNPSASSVMTRASHWRRRHFCDKVIASED
jgi:hypothetical protein